MAEAEGRSLALVDMLAMAKAEVPALAAAEVPGLAKAEGPALALADMSPWLEQTSQVWPRQKVQHCRDRRASPGCSRSARSG